MAKIYCGIDPGNNGAVAILNQSGQIIKLSTFPKIKKEIDEYEMANMIANLKTNEQTFIGLEDVHALFGSSAKSTFSFGHICGFIKGLIVGASLPFAEIQPKTWQKVMFEGVPEVFKPMKEGQKKKVRDTKAMALIAAKRLFPTADLRESTRCKNPHDGIVDALLIAEYIRRKY